MTPSIDRSTAPLPVLAQPTQRAFRAASTKLASTAPSFMREANIWGDLDLFLAIQIPKPRLGQDKKFEVQGDSTPVPDPEAKGATTTAPSSSKASAGNDDDGDDSASDGLEADAPETGDETTDTNASQVVLAEKEARRSRKHKSSKGNGKAQADLVQYHVMLALKQMTRHDTYRGPNRYAPLQAKGQQTLRAFFDKVAPNPMPSRPATPLTWAQLYLASKRLEEK